jgi:hypothetical protein
VDRTAEVGLAKVARGARAAIDHGRAQVRGREIVGAVVGRVVGVAEGDAIEGEVEFAVLEAAQGDDVVVADPAGVGGDAGDAGRDLQHRRPAAGLRRRLLDELMGDDRFGLHLVQRGLGGRRASHRIGLRRHDETLHLLALAAGARVVAGGRRLVGVRRASGARQRGAEDQRCG